MQKLINLLALASFGVSAAVVGAGAYVYLNKDALIESAKKAAIEQVTASVSEALPGMIQGAMPEIPKMPSVTGGAIPQGGASLPKTTGPAIPF
jgi:hypothetical protein